MEDSSHSLQTSGHCSISLTELATAQPVIVSALLPDRNRKVLICDLPQPPCPNRRKSHCFMLTCGWSRSQKRGLFHWGHSRVQ